MATPTAYTTDEIADKGEALYAHDIWAKVEDGNVGRYIAIDIETRQYEVGEEHLATVNRLLTRRPGAIVYTMLIGYPAAAAIGSLLRPLHYLARSR